MIKNHIQRISDSKDNYILCRDTDLNKLVKWFSSAKIKKYYSDILLPQTANTYDEIALIETELTKEDLTKDERNSLNNLLVTYNTRLKKLSVKNIATQNQINSETNKISRNRDIGILILSILISGFTYYQSTTSSNEQLTTIKTEVNKANSKATTQIIEKIDKVDSLYKVIESQKTLILNLNNKIDSLTNKKKPKKNSQR